MAKIHLDRLKIKYPEAFKPGQTTGINYQNLMAEIIANNHESTQRAVARLKSDHLSKQVATMRKSTAKQLAVPDISEVLPKRSVFIRKGATNGNIISETLRDRLTSDLRETVKEYLTAGKGSMQYRRGEQRGQIRPELIDKMRERITGTFESYAKRTKGEMPSNIETIAQTETRSAISDIKHTWAKQVMDANPGKVRFTKTWRHHPGLSDIPRAGHRMQDGLTIGMDAFFKVPLLIKGKNGFHWGSVERMLHPHDPSASPGNVINCKCSVDYNIEVL